MFTVIAFDEFNNVTHIECNSYSEASIIEDIYLDDGYTTHIVSVS